MTLKDVLPTLVNSDRLIIKSIENKMLYHGFRGLLESTIPAQILEEDLPITRITYYSDLTSKDYKSKGYTAPIDPNTTSDYEYSDLEERIYLEITLDISKIIDAEKQAGEN